MSEDNCTICGAKRKEPQTIKIGGHTITIDFECKFIDDEVYKLGSFDIVKHVIEIRKGLEKSRAESTLLHELIEWLNNDLELGIEHKSITTLAEGLYQIIADNKLFNYAEKIDST